MYTHKNNNNDNSLDPNYIILKNEFNNLYNNCISLNDSINNYCHRIKDIYLNSNGLFKNIKNNFNFEHPLNAYSEQLLNYVEQSFNDWLTNQQYTLDSISNYCRQLGDIKYKIQQVDTLELNGLSNNTSNYQFQQNQQYQYNLEKQLLFDNVKNCFDNKLQEFDIPIINFQFSINSLFECLNNIHSTSINNLKSNQNITNFNPISNLQPINIFNNNNNINNNNISSPQTAKPYNPRPVTPPSTYNVSQQQQQQYQQLPSTYNTVPQSPTTPPQLIKPLRPAPIPKEILESQQKQQQQQQPKPQIPIFKPKPQQFSPSPSVSNYNQYEGPPPLEPLPYSPDINYPQLIRPPLRSVSPPQPTHDPYGQPIKPVEAQQPPIPFSQLKPVISTKSTSPPTGVKSKSLLNLNKQPVQQNPSISTPNIQNQPNKSKSILNLNKSSQKQQQQQQIISDGSGKYLKSNPFIIPNDSKLHPTIDQLMFDHETHSKMWNRYFKLNKIYKYKIRFIHKKSFKFEGQLNFINYYWYKPQSFHFQDIISSTCKLVDDVTGKTIESIEIPTCLYNAYKLEYKSPPPNSKYTLYHITESNLFSNELEEIQPNESTNQCEPISEKEIKIYTRCEEEITFTSKEFKQFIDQYKLYPLKLKDGSIETTICFAYRVSLFIYKHITYNINSKSQLPLVTFSKKTANCESFSNLFSSILRYNNIPVRFISGKSVDKDKNHTFGKHAQTEFYVNNIGWIPYNGAARDCYVYNKFAFGKNNGDLFVQEAHSITDMEYGSGKFLSIVLPASTYSYSGKDIVWSQPIDIFDLEKLHQV